MMYRLMKATHEYGAGTATYYQTSSKSLEVVMDLLQTMREDCEKMAAGDLHELMRAWEIYHRIWTVEVASAAHSVPERNPLSRILLSGGLPRTG